MYVQRLFFLSPVGKLIAAKMQLPEVDGSLSIIKDAQSILRITHLDDLCLYAKRLNVVSVLVKAVHDYVTSPD